MEEISYKLKSGNSLLVASAVNKLLVGARASAGNEESEALRALRDACGSVEPAVALVACQGLLTLAESGVISPAHTMSTMMAKLPSAESYTAIITTICGLLTMEVRSASSEYVCRFSLRSPRHPLVTVLERSPAAADDVLGQMEALCCHPHATISENSVELLRPVFLWLVCHPSEPHSLRWRSHCWRLLLALRCRGKQALVRECLLWQLTSTPEHLHAAFSVYGALADSAVQQQDADCAAALVPALARLSNHFIRQGLDPRPCYTSIGRCVATRAPPLQRSAGLVLALLAENAPLSPALFLHALYALCHKLVATYEFPSIALSILIAHSLQWLHSPSRLTAEALEVVEKLLIVHRSKQAFDNRLHMSALLENEMFQDLLHTDKRLLFVFEQFKTWEGVRNDKDSMEKWLGSIGENIHMDVKREFVPFCLGVLLERRLDPSIALKALKITLEVVKSDDNLMVLTLPILLYKVANDSTPMVHLECLKAIPLMASCKANVPTVVSFLNKLKASNGAPVSLLLALHTALVAACGRCYPYLQALILDGGAGDPHVSLKWESEIARAAAVLDLCETRAAACGAELVPTVSALLNRCGDAAGAAASALAVAALRALWRGRVVSPPSTWRALAPRMARDRRPAVHVSMCELLGEVPSLHAPTADHEELAAEAARTLWGQLAAAHRADVAAAAGGALAGYRPEQCPLRLVPDVYRRTVKLPASYCKTPVDAARRPEDVLDYIPSEVWPEVFLNTSQACVGGVQALAAALLEREVRAYRGGVYRTEQAGRPEPESLHFLPPHSVARGLLEFLRRQALSPTYECADTVLLAMLECVARPLPRPLPPLDMCFLHELFHRGRHYRRPSLLLAARQALTSLSAKRFVETYLAAAEPDDEKEDEMMDVFEILGALCATVPPATLRTVLQKYLAHAHSKMLATERKAGDGQDVESLPFVRQLRSIAECLQDERIHDANRTLLSQLVEHYWTLIDDDSVAWAAYEAACCALSGQFLERMTSPSSWWETTAEALRRAALVRARLAGAALVWLNEIVGAGVGWPSEHMFVLRAIAAPLAEAPPDADSRDWLLQLMARVQVAIAESPEDSAGLAFLCDVFTLSVVQLSGCGSVARTPERVHESRALRCRLLPAAAAVLLAAPHWRDAAPQMIEWLQHTRTIPGVPAACCLSFYRALVACRHAAHFAQHATWTRVLGVRLS